MEIRKLVGVIVVFGAVSLATVKAFPAYENKYDRIDLNKILSTRRLVTLYIRCLLNEGPCTPGGAYLSTVLPEAIQTNCKKCSHRQKEGAKIAIRRLETEYKDDWRRVMAHFKLSKKLIDKFMTT